MLKNGLYNYGFQVSPPNSQSDLETVRTGTIARTISFAQEGPEAAVKRIKAYTECGVDAIFLAGHPRGAEDIQAACKATNLPLIVGRTTPELRDPKFLAENNCRFAGFG